MSLETYYHGKLLDGVAGNGAEALRTAIVNVENATSITAIYSLDYVAATSMTLSLYESVDGGTIYGLVQSISLATGVGTLSDYVPTKAVGAADKVIPIKFNCESDSHIKLVCTATGAGATDLITLQVASSVYR